MWEFYRTVFASYHESTVTVWQYTARNTVNTNFIIVGRFHQLSRLDCIEMDEVFCERWLYCWKITYSGS